MGDPRVRRERLYWCSRKLNALLLAFHYTYDLMTALHIWILGIYPQAKGVWTVSC
jgi:hypothetical protein